MSDAPAGRRGREEKTPRRALSDRAIDRLRRVADEPALDLSGTPYRVIGEIGRGGMGAVYLAHDAELDREVALKVAAAPAGEAADLSRRLRQEAAILARLEHPGIVPVHDVGRLPDGRAYYVMKRVRGRRLDQVVADGAERGSLLRAFGRICEAVASAHANGVLHRDLKPENVMVGPFGEVLVMDWGAAKILGPGDGEPESERHAGAGAGAAPVGTEHGTVIGTPGYMAPEQARGEIGSLGPASDVYALGAILYFLLVRRHPPARALAGRDDALAPRRLDPKIPRALAAIVLRAMAPTPAGRYATPEALAADVSLFTERLPVSAYPEGLFLKAVRLAGKYQTAIWLVLAYVVMRWLLMYFR